jgi:hypothetical protein
MIHRSAIVQVAKKKSIVAKIPAGLLRHRLSDFSHSRTTFEASQKTQQDFLETPISGLGAFQFRHSLSQLVNIERFSDKSHA